ncbi:transposase [Desertibacillus haloalkaliphilus]|uniref:transposase n=1 Tax=Desertibacillus haloalkaliphilus TaxID=1328930 RepID=UPI001FE39BCC|nr:transposase [Desertibacillus haloalkaliphilus]
MKTTRLLKLKGLSKQDKSKLDDLLRVFSSMTRYAFNRLLEGEKTGDLHKTLPEKFKMNKRYAEDAVLQAQSIITSQKELLPSRIEDAEAKLKKLEKKFHLYQTGRRKPKRTDLETALIGLGQRKEKLERKLYELNDHQERGTIPPVIFGGKKNFIARRKGLLSKQAWKDLRTNHLYARGDKAKKGNLNIRLLHHDDRFFLEIANPLLTPEDKTKAPRIKVEVTGLINILKRLSMWLSLMIRRKGHFNRTRWKLSVRMAIISFTSTTTKKSMEKRFMRLVSIMMSSQGLTLTLIE